MSSGETNFLNRIRSNPEESILAERDEKQKSLWWKKFPKETFILVVFSIAVPLLMYYFLIDTQIVPPDGKGTCLVDRSFMVPCGKENISENDCTEIFCCYDHDFCYHYLPSEYYYSPKKNGSIPSQTTTPFGNPTTKVKLAITEIDENTVSISLQKSEEISVSNNTNYFVNVTENKLYVEVFRNDSKEILLSTGKGPLIFSEKYWEWTLYLTSDKLYGLGETLIELDENSTLTKVIYKNKDNHNTEPIFWAYKNGSFHGVKIKHEGPLEVTVLPSNLIILRGLIDSSIEIELSIGPSPKDLRKQQQGIFKDFPEWLLGTHVCRSTSSVPDFNTILTAFNKTDVTHDSDCIHENLLMTLMYKINDTEYKDLESVVKTKLVDEGKKFLLSVPPHLLPMGEAYDKALTANILYQMDNKNYTGAYLEDEVYFPDFSAKGIDDYIKVLFESLIKEPLRDAISGVILTNDWPLNDNYTMENSADFPYLSQFLESAMSYTLPWNSVSQGISHITNHNSYGHHHIESIKRYFSSINRTDIIIMSSSYSFGALDYLIEEVIENIDISWENFKFHTKNVLFNSMIGNDFISVPVCGSTSNFDKTFHDKLCIRWYILASTMPLFRISSDEPWRDPDNLEYFYTKTIAKKAISLRNSLLKYYYTFLKNGEPLIRPMLYDFYDEDMVLNLDEQYMVGDKMLVAHPFTSGQNFLRIYLPKKIGTWYEYWSGTKYEHGTDGFIKFPIVESDFVIFVAQGSIIPLKPADDVLNLLVAQKCTKSNCTANGEFYEGENLLKMTANNKNITISNITEDFKTYVKCDSGGTYTIQNIRYFDGNIENSPAYTVDGPNNLCEADVELLINIVIEP